jgi:CheY-like chemotaxis protein
MSMSESPGPDGVPRVSEGVPRVSEGVPRVSEGVPRVLVVDDRPENLLALEAILQGMPVQTVGVGSGEAALKQLLLHEFALILLDAQMPDMDGFETARRIKQRERTRGIPIVFLTAADYNAHLALRGYAAGAVDYLTKPIDPWVLRAKVAVLVDLWEKNRRVRAQAALTARYQRRIATAAERVERALALVQGVGDSDVGRELRSLLEQLLDDLQE